MRTILASAAIILCSTLSLAAADKKKGNKQKDSAFKSRDKNGDGYISIQEYMELRPAPRKAAVDFKKLDKNGDYKLSPEEFGASGD